MHTRRSCHLHACLGVCLQAVLVMVTHIVVSNGGLRRAFSSCASVALVLSHPLFVFGDDTKPVSLSAKYFGGRLVVWTESA